MNKKNSIGMICGMVSGTLWGFSGVWSQILLHDYNVDLNWLVMIRLIISGIILLIISSIKYRDKMICVFKKDIIFELLFFAVIGMAATQYTYFATIKYSNAPTATVLQYLSPVLILCYLSIKNRRFPVWINIFAVILAIIGIFFICTKGNIGKLIISKEALEWGLVSAVAMMIYTLQPVNLIKKCEPIIIIGYAMLIGGVVLGIGTGCYNKYVPLDIKGIIVLFFIVAFGTIVPYSTYIISTYLIGGSKTNLYSSVEPFSATLMSVLLTNTIIHLVDIIGISLIFIMILLISNNKEFELRRKKYENRR